ncbi:MAG: S-layer homology domain-containing protein, partial [Oscillospiraceae bacterium]|nr:S-layer homology domain-containing protein [Oscillospiraceae bacterium]
MNRTKKTIALLLAVVMVFGLVPGGMLAAEEVPPIEHNSALEADVTTTLEPGPWADHFIEPMHSGFGAGFRWWLPLGMTDDAELERQMRSMSDQGFHVVEVASSITGLIGPIPGDPAGVHFLERYGFGSLEWSRTLQTILRVADELDMRVDFHVSMHNGANKHVPGMSPNDDGASEILVHHRYALDMGVPALTMSNMPVLADITPPQVTYTSNVDGSTGNPVDQFLQAALLVNIAERGRLEERIRMDDGMASQGLFGLLTFEAVVDVIDPAYTIDVTALFDGTTDTTALEAEVNTALAGDIDGEWEVLGFWSRAELRTASNATRWPSFKVDYGSAEGADALMDFYETYVFRFDQPGFEDMRDLVRANGGRNGNIFADSYGQDSNWSRHLFERFEENTGQSIIPYLPAIIEPTGPMPAWVGGTGVNREGGPDGFVILDQDFTDAILAEYNQTITEIYGQVHLARLRERLHDLGLLYRAQVVYAATGSGAMRMDMIQVYAHVDIPDAESLNNNDSIEYYTAIATAAHFLGLDEVGNEMGAIQGDLSGSYQYNMVTALEQANRAFAGGVNQQIFHGYTYNYQNYDLPQSRWPGRAAWRGGFGNDFKDNLPEWTTMDIYADYHSRVAYAVRRGTVTRDVAIYKMSYWWPRHTGILWNSDAMHDAGFTYDFVSPYLFHFPQAFVEDGVLAPETAGYRAFIFDTLGQRTQQDIAYDIIPLFAIEKLVEFAEDGLPIVFVGGYPVGLQGFADEGDQQAFEAALAALQAFDHVVMVDTRADVPEALKDLGVRPAAENLDPSRMISFRTVDDDGVNAYFVYNQSRNWISDWPSTRNWIGMFHPAVMAEVERLGPSSAGNIINGVQVFGPVGNDGTGFPAQQALLNEVLTDGEFISTRMAFEGEGIPWMVDPYSGAVTAIADYEIDGFGRFVVDVSLEAFDSTIIVIGPTADGSTPLHGLITDGPEGRLVYHGDAIAVKAFEVGTFEVELSNGHDMEVTAEALAEFTLSNWDLVIASYTNANDPFAYGQEATEMLITEIAVGELDELVGWRELGEVAATFTAPDGTETTGTIHLETVSGVGTYTATLTAPANLTDLDGVFMHVPDPHNVFRVFVNGVELGNTSPFGGMADLGPYIEPGDNEVQIVIASTIGNAVRNFVLENPGVYTYNKTYLHNYGLRADVELVPYVLVHVSSLLEFHEAYMFGSPTGEFMPRENINRAEVAAILVRTKLPAFEVGELPGDMDSFDVFPDVTEANWFYYYVAWAYYEGLVQGDDRGRFLPRAPIARQELAAMLSRTLEEYEEETGEMPFNDVADISNWAV